MNTLHDMFKEHMKANYEAIKVNGIDKKAFLKEIDDKSVNTDTKYIFTEIGVIKQGDKINAFGSEWFIVTEAISFNNVYSKAIMQRCNANLKVLVNSLITKIPCIIMDNVIMGVDSNNNISTVDSNYYIIVRSEEIASKIAINDIYSIGKFNYSVIGINDISKSGLLTLKMKFSEAAQPLPVYTISILNTLTTDVETTIQIQVQVSSSINGTSSVITPTPKVRYFLSDSTIGTISDSGLFTPLKDGTATVTVKMASDETVLTTTNITVSVRQDNYTYTIDGLAEIKTNSTLWRVYTATRFNNGIADSSGKFTFTLDAGGCPTTKYKFEVLDDNNCKILYIDSKTYYATLKVKDTVTGTETTKAIKFKSSV